MNPLELLSELFLEDLDESVRVRDRRSDDTGDPHFLRDPSHVCQSCGEEYYTDPELEIDSCRDCGGVKVEAASDE